MAASFPHVIDSVCAPGMCCSCAVVIGFLLSMSNHPEWGVWNPLTAFRLVQESRSHVSVGKGKFLEIHYFYLRQRVRRGYFLKNPQAMTAWLNRAVDICDRAKEPIKGYRREHEKLIKLIDDFNKPRSLILPDAVQRQKQLVRALEHDMTRTLQQYAAHCSKAHFREGQLSCVGGSGRGHVVWCGAARRGGGAMTHCVTL